MILKGSQRSAGGQLATHLLNDLDNDHVTIHEVRGFMSGDLKGALAEAHAISKGTRCKQFMFSLSLNPPKDQDCSIEQLVDAANRAEQVLGLEGQPRTLVIHEKEGRRHIHAVWSRIDIAEMKAVPLPFFKNKLAALSKELYLEHGWELPDGHRENGWKSSLDFDLAEWQQAKRIGLDPREIKQLFADAWRHSDGAKSFAAALEDRGFLLARGDRRGFVAVDIHGEVLSVARQVGITTKLLEARLGSPDSLRSVEQTRAHISEQLTDRMRDLLAAQRDRHAQEFKSLGDERRLLLREQRAERERVRTLQEARQRAETAERQRGFRRGIRGLWDVLTGRAAHPERARIIQIIPSRRRTERRLVRSTNGGTARPYKPH